MSSLWECGDRPLGIRDYKASEPWTETRAKVAANWLGS